MDINVTYHWTYLDYLTPNFKKGNWSPIARAAIEIYAELLTVEGNKELRGIYSHLTIPITGTMDPKEEIIQSIEKFGKEQNITIEMDCLNGKGIDWDYEF